MILKKISTPPFGFFSVRSFLTSKASRIDSYSASTLLSSCFKSGKIREAEILFDEIPDRNVVSWSILVHGYAINGMYGRCLEAFSIMRLSGVVPNSFTFVGLLVGVQGVRKLVLVHSVYGLILKSGMDPDPVVATSLLDSFAKCGSLEDSCKVFNTMKNPGLVSCNAMISGYIQNEFFEQGISSFNRFRKHGLIPNASTLMSVVKGCTSLEMNSLCKSIHSMIVKLGLEAETSLNNAMIDMYSCFMDLESAIRIFESMEEKDVISWTTMIRLQLSLGYPVDALNLFIDMRASNVHIDAIIAMNLVSACTVLGDLRRGKQIHCQAIVYGFESETHLANSLVSMYSKCGDFDSSRIVFYRINEKSLVSWTAMISGHLHNGKPIEALDLFTEFRLRDNHTFDSALLVNIITASGEIAGFELVQQLHCLAFKAGSFRERSVQNSLIPAYSKCGDTNLSRIVFNEMDHLRNIISWNSIINGYCINGQGKAALTLYKEMRKHGERPDSATYLCVIGACSHGGLVKEGLKVFNDLLEDDNVKMEKEHKGCIIDMLARGGWLVEANRIISENLEMMNSNVLRSLLTGCVLHGNVGLAEIVAKGLSERRDGMNSGDVVLLSNVYASVGRFEDAEELRLSMDQCGLRKHVGISTST